MSTAVRHRTPPEIDGLYRCMAAAFDGLHGPAEREANRRILNSHRHLWVAPF